MTQFRWEKKVMMYGDNMIVQKGTSGVSSDTNKWLHSSMGRSHRKLQNITNNSGGGKMIPLCLEKKHDDI